MCFKLDGYELFFDLKRYVIKSDKPTNVSVVGWFFIIVSSLSILSAIGYILQQDKDHTKDKI